MRKMVQAVESHTDQLGLQRSDQLRELYESLLLGETNPQVKRPTATLSPEDLTDAEWYFLICMSFVFNIGQGLPGRTLSKKQTIWLCNAHHVDTKVFSRSLLAKSASIQTIVCFSHLGGVVELGTTELVPEDLNLIQRIKTSFLGIPNIVPKILNHMSNSMANNNLIHEVLERANMTENRLDQFLDCPDLDICSPNDSSGYFSDNLLREELNFVEAIVGEISQKQGLAFMDEALSNCLNNSTNSSDCISQTFGNPESVPLSDGKTATDNYVHDALECNQQKQNSSDHVHYQSVLSNLLKSSHNLIISPYFRKVNQESSFAGWNKDGFSGANVRKKGTPQRLLKKVLFDVARMHENSQLQSGKRNGKGDDVSRPEVDEVDRNHVLSERKRREKINERFMILGSLIPSGGKVDKVSVLDHTIEYLRELERKVEELQSERESMTHTKPHDSIERTSDNYGPKIGIDSLKKPLTNKRKACDQSGAENSKVQLRDSPLDNITVNISDKDVLIEMNCSWRESVFIEVMEVVSKLRMDTEAVQSSNVDGMFSITIKAKAKGLKVASASVIRQALHRITKKS